LHRFRKVIPLILFLLALVLYATFLSSSFEEWDSVQFALGVKDYDVARHQPHPPGYPVYVFLGWVLYQITHSMVFSLAIVNAVFAAVAIVPFYYLGEKIFDEKVALISSLLLIVNPAYWLTAEKTLSDGLAVSLIMVSIYFLYSELHSSDNRRVYASFILLGLAIGVRQTLFPFLIVWIVFLWKKRRIMLQGGTLFLLTCLSWFIPMVYLTGFDRYLMATKGQSAVLYGDSIFNPSITSYGVLKRIFYEYLIKDYLWISWGAVPHLEPLILKLLSIATFAVLFMLGIRFLLNVKLKKWSFRKTFFLLVLIPYGVWMILMMAPLNDRYVLPTVPWLCLLLGWVSWKKGFRYDKIRTGVIVSLILMTSIHTAYYANILHNVSSPPTQLVDYVTRHYDPATTLILCSSEKRYFDYYHPEYNVIIVYDPIEAAGVMNKFNGTILITDFAAQRLSSTVKIENKLTLVASFERDTLVHRRNWKILLYEYER